MLAFVGIQFTISGVKMTRGLRFLGATTATAVLVALGGVAPSQAIDPDSPTQESVVTNLLESDVTDLVDVAARAPAEVPAASGVSFALPATLAGDPLVSQSEIASAAPGVSITSAGSEPQIAFQIAGSADAHRFAFTVAGADELVQTPSGEVVLFKQGEQLGHLQAPWAIAADGMSVPTRFEVNGTEVTQVIDAAVGTAYPIVADPSYDTDWFPIPTVKIKFNQTETSDIADISGVGAAGACAVKFKDPRAIAACGIIVGTAGVIARRAAANGNCLSIQIRALPPFGLVAYPWIVNC